MTLGRSGRNPEFPVLTHLMFWAADEAQAFKLAPRPIERALEIMAGMPPKSAIMTLLDVDDPETEMPIELVGLETPEAVAGAMQQLAINLVRRAG
jgi:hypothetical protein